MDVRELFGAGVSTELQSLEADPRLVKRSRKILEKWRESPALGFPDIFDDAELEAAYRFFNNEGLSFDMLLQPHSDCTRQRAMKFGGDILCIQDTSTFVFEGERKGLGFIHKNNRGFLGHFALVVSRAQGQQPIPFGVVAASTWIRSELRRDRQISQHKLRGSDDCESHRWMTTTQRVEQVFRGILSPIHVMDREGDIYDSLSTMVRDHRRFVVRAMANRKIKSDDQEFSLLFDALDGLPVRSRDQVCVAPRATSRLPDQNKAHPAREGRTADVCVAATKVVLKRTRNSQSHFPETTQLNVVHLFEPTPPEGEPPVEWVLLTSEPIETEADLRRVIECYRQRWLIEEFFKAIKTGCAFEKRQLTTYRALTSALALTLPLAWEMLLLRAQSRAQETESLPAETFMSPVRLEALRAYAKQRKRYAMPENPTLRDVAYAVAKLGGHLKRNGPPGWQTLRRGYERLLTFEQGWLASRKTCDQS